MQTLYCLGLYLLDTAHRNSNIDISDKKIDSIIMMFIRNNNCTGIHGWGEGEVSS